MFGSLEMQAPKGGAGVATTGARLQKLYCSQVDANAGKPLCNSLGRLTRSPLLEQESGLG